MPDFGIGELLSIAGPIIGGVMGGNAAQSAADTQAGAADRASQVQQGIFNQTRSDLGPYRDQGGVSLEALKRGLGLPGYNPDMAIAGPGGESLLGTGQLLKPFSMADFQESPAYQFNLQQGQNAIDKASRARGKYYAPSTLQDISRFSQGLASNEFQNSYNNYNTNMGNIWNRLYSMSGMGQSAANQTGAFGSTMASNVGNNITSAGAAQAAGQVGSANAISGGLSGAYNNYLTQQLLAGNQQSGYGGTGYGGPLMDGLPNLLGEG